MADAMGLHRGNATERGRSDEQGGGHDEWGSRSPRSEAKNGFPAASSDSTVRGWKIAQLGAASSSGAPRLGRIREKGRPDNW
ncbi:MAG: hypothetical protein M2R45_00147 [Verrucomicrobia subdivision 3 bacterium]|nr:hypothetical protein [Limisphaerales bacterium]MCS1412393.1 hypothetical protein [Limisphaerales bacterium]